MRKIGWIGLGKMGLPMALRILESGHNLNIYNRTQSKMNSFQKQNTTQHENTADLAQQSDLIISMISDDKAIKEIALGNEGVLNHAKKGTTYIDMSTISPDISAEIGHMAKQKGVYYLRAPVNGTVMQVENSTLVILISGPKEIFNINQDLFNILGNKIYYVGEQEQARYLKLSINMMVGISAIMMAEALALGSSGGLDRDLMVDIIKNSAVGSPLINYKEKTLKERDFTPAFSAEQMAKDFDLILQAGRSANVPLTMTAQTRENWSTMISMGRGEQDYFGYADLLEKLAGQND
jgi:3-hydroxyisobutyrate dehydrogenase-like beta-hydroxyacid dehydrogenase